MTWTLFFQILGPLSAFALCFALGRAHRANAQLRKSVQDLIEANEAQHTVIMNHQRIVQLTTAANVRHVLQQVAPAAWTPGHERSFQQLQQEAKAAGMTVKFTYEPGAILPKMPEKSGMN